MASKIDTIELWHGSHRWDPPPEIRAPKKGNAEHGAGIYTTTHYMTAAKYAKGGGALVKIQLRGDLKFLEGVDVAPQELLDVARSIPRLKKRDEIMNDIERCTRRSRDPNAIGLNTLLNLAVNYDAMIGSPALAITDHLVSKGIDASLYERPGSENWLVVFNPKIIVNAKIRPASTVDLSEYELPEVKDQLKLLNEKRIQRALDAQSVVEEIKKTTAKPGFRQKA